MYCISIRPISSFISQKIRENVFIQKIHDGSLAAEEFLYYSEQDDLYLEEWARIILVLLENLKSHVLMEDKEFSDDICFVEKHLKNVKRMIDEGVFNPKRKESSFLRPDRSQVIHDYLSHLEQSNCSGSHTVALASLLGCYDVYQHVGVYSQSRHVDTTHPYRDWLSANYDQEFVETGERVFRLTERMMTFELTTGRLEEPTLARDAAFKSYDYEWQFFDHVVSHRQLEREFSHGV
jgi:thiaminase